MATMASASLLPRFSTATATSPSSRAGIQLLHQRGLSSSAEHRGPPKVNFWDNPLHPSRWKDEHFVIVSLTSWGLLFYGGYRHFIKGKNKERQKKVEDRSRYRKIYNKTDALVKLSKNGSSCMPLRRIIWENK